MKMRTNEAKSIGECFGIFVFRLDLSELLKRVRGGGILGKKVFIYSKRLRNVLLRDGLVVQ
jgi:hypothetical protein